MDKTSYSGFILVLMAATLWGTTGTSQALAPDGVTPLTIGALRILIGGVALLLLAWGRGGFRQGGAWSIPLLVIAALCTAIYQVTFFGGTYLTGVAVGTIVGIGSVPVFTGLLGVLFEDEKLSQRWLLATGLAVGGVGLLTLAGGQTVTISPVGVILALGAGLSYAIFTLVNKRLLHNHTADEVMALSFCTGALLLLPFLIIGDITWVFTTRGMAVTLHLGLIATGLAYALFGRGLRTVAVSTVGTLTLAEPLTAALLGILLLRESVPLLGWGGILLIVMGLALLAFPKS